MVFSRHPDSRTGPVLEVGVTIAGVLLMVGAGIAASPYTPSWFDPDDGPARSAGGVLTAMWVLEAVGLAMVLAGLVLTGRELRRMPAPPVTRPLPAWAEVVACAIAGAVLCAVVGWFVLVGVLLSAPAIPAGLCLFWLVHAAALTALDRRVAAAHASAFPSWLAGLVVGAAGVAAVVWWAVEMRGMLWASPVVDGAALALGLLAWRAAAGGIRPSQAGIGALGILAAAAAAAVIVATSGADHVGADQVGGVDSPAAPVLPPRAAVPAAPSAVPQPSPAPVDASVACAPEDLTWSATGWDAAMGTRAVSVVATSHADRPCYVDGFPGITLAQGGRDLRLTTEPGSPSGPEVPEARRVGLAPGGTASFPLIWKGYGAAADEDTPQELRVTLAGGEPSTVALGTSPAPFDLVDGGTIRVGPWQPGP